MSQAFFLRQDSPWVFRTGRPFGAADAGGGADSHAFPLPGTIAGAFRAAWCDADGADTVPRDPVRAAIAVRGPLRCVRHDKKPLENFLPAPADAALVVKKVRSSPPPRLVPLLPRQFNEGGGSDLPNGLQALLPGDPLGAGESLEPVNSWWRAGDVVNWLADPAPASARTTPLPAPEFDDRTHVGIDGESWLGKASALFVSRGLDLTLPAEQAEADQGLYVWAEAPAEAERGLAAMNGRHCRIGADGRTGTWIALDGAAGALPNIPGLLRSRLDEVAVGDVVRLYLASPACYLRNGWYPDGMKPEDGCIQGTPEGVTGWRFKLVAAAVGRFQPYCGSSMRRADGAPGFSAGALRRLVPAGSVYWLKVLERPVDQAACSLASRWLQPTCRVEYGRDGHGLGLWGAA